MNASPFQATGRAATKSKQTITVKMRVTGRFYCSVEVDDAKDEDAIRRSCGSSAFRCRFWSTL